MNTSIIGYTTSKLVATHEGVIGAASAGFVFGVLVGMAIMMVWLRRKA